MKREGNIPGRFQATYHRLRKFRIPYRITFIIIGILSTAWFLVRVIPKPSRAGYPCMRTAAPFMSSFVIYLLALSGSALLVKRARSLFHRARYALAGIAFLGALVLFALTGNLFWPELKAFELTSIGEKNNNQEVIDRMLGEVVEKITGNTPGGEVFRVKALYIDASGVKWFGTNRGLYRYDNLVWKYYAGPDHLVGKEIHALTFEVMDRLWIATASGVSVVTLSPEGITGSMGYTPADGLLDESVSDIALDSHGRKYFGSASGITVLKGDTLDSLLYVDYVASMVNAPVNTLFCYNDTLYVGADGGIGRFVAGVDGISGASRWTSNWGITPLSDNIKSILVDSRGHQWFGTDSGVEEHVGHKAKENWFLYTTDEGLVDNHVLAIAEDPAGGMWFGTQGGVSAFSGGNWTSYTLADGLVSDTVYDIGFDTDGSAWFATERGICRLKDGSFTDLFLDVAQERSIVRTFEPWYDPLSGIVGITYLLQEPGEVTARLYTLDGRLAGRWSGLPGNLGEHRVPLAPEGIHGTLLQGVYLVQLQQGNRSETKKLVIISGK